MTEQVQVKKDPWLTLWIAVRFVVFGVGGFFALWIGWLMLAVVLDPISPKGRWDLLGLPLALAGGLMMLFGSGMWRRWAYLWVFYSTPIVLVTMLTLASYKQNLDRYIPGPLIAFLFFIAPMPVSYWLVRIYYGRRKAPQRPSAPVPQIANNEEGSR